MMPYSNSSDHNTWARKYREKNRDKINAQRAQRKLWKKLSEDDEQRGRAAAALDEMLAGTPSDDLRKVFNVVARCTPLMLEELVSRSKT